MNYQHIVVACKCDTVHLSNVIFLLSFFYSIVSKKRKQFECDSEGRNVFIKKKKKYESDYFIDRVFLILKILLN